MANERITEGFVRDELRRLNEDTVIRDKDGRYISASKESVKEHGEVMTPPEIVKLMLDQIPEEVWKDETYIVLEPSCGTGHFLIEVYERKVLAGLTPEQAVNTIIGMDINKKTLKTARQELIKCALKNAHTLNKKDREVFSKRIHQIVQNNIFWVKDSIAFLKGEGEDERGNKGFATKKFVYTDPNEHVMDDNKRNAILK